MLKRARHVAAIGWFALVATCVFWKVVFAQQVLYWGDLMLYFYPMLTFVHRCFDQGILPLWNPFTLFGQPYVGNPQEWLFYPMALLLHFMPPASYISWNAVIHLWLAGVGMWLFIRALGASSRAALIVSTAWMLCGAFVPRAQFPGMFQEIALLSWLMWAAEMFVRSPTARRFAILATLVGLVLLAGHAQTAYFSLLLATTWTVWRVGTAKIRILLTAAGAATMGVLLSAAHWLPMVQLLEQTPRLHLSLYGVNRFPLHPEQMLLLIAPDLFGTPWQSNWVGRGNYWETSWTVGILPLMAALMSWRASRTARFWLFVALITLWLSLGTKAGLYAALYYLVPGMKAFHDPARWLILTDFALLTAAALGWDSLRFSRQWLWLPAGIITVGLLWHWQGAEITHWTAHLDPVRASRPETLSKELVESTVANGTLGLWRTAAIALASVLSLRTTIPVRTLFAILIVLLNLLPFAMQANPTCAAAVFEQPPVSAKTVLATGGRHLVPDQAPMWRKYVSYVDYGSNDRLTLRRWQEMLGSNIGMIWGVAEASGYEPVAVKSAVRYYRNLSDQWKRSPDDPALQVELQRAGVGAIATGSTADDWRVFALPLHPKRAWHVESGAALQVRELSPQQVEVLSPPAGTIVIADTAYPGWTAEVEGKPVPHNMYNGVFRSVALSEPVSRILWRYKPDSFRVGLYLSLMGCGALTGIFIFSYVAGKTATTSKLPR